MLTSTSSKAMDASTSSDLQVEDVTVGFLVGLYSAKTAAWWTLTLGIIGLGYRSRKARVKGWSLYICIAVTVLLTALQASTQLAHDDAVYRKRNSVQALAKTSIFFDSLAESSFIALLLLMASGYCITRFDLGPHKDQVLYIPLVYLVSGLITGYITDHFIRTSRLSNLNELSGLEELLWFICSLVNMATLLLSWVYIFDALGKEGEALARQANPSLARSLTEQEEGRQGQGLGPEGVAGARRTAGENLLRAGQNSSHIPAAEGEGRHEDNEDVEEGGIHSVAERLSYEKKRILLNRFGLGVTVYFISQVMTLLLPVFFLKNVQYVILVVSFLLKLVFTGVLAYIFRPVGDNPYLMVGLDLEDAEAKGVPDLSTELGVLETEDTEPEAVHLPGGSTPTVKVNGSHTHRPPHDVRSGLRDQQGGPSTTSANGSASQIGGNTGVVLDPVTSSEFNKKLTIRTGTLPISEPLPQYSLGEDELDMTDLHDVRLNGK